MSDFTINKIYISDVSAGLAAQKRAYDEPESAQFQDVSRQFETLLLHQVIKQMQETVEYSALDEDDEGGHQMYSLYGMFLADAIGQQGGVGFASYMAEYLAGVYQNTGSASAALPFGLDERL